MQNKARRFPAKQRPITQVVRADSGAQALKRVFAYISQVAENLSRDTILKAAAEAAPQTEEILMTLAEQWKQEGRREGRQEGRREGRQEGRREGERLLLEKQLRLKFGELPATVQARLSAGTEEDLSRWAERVLIAGSLHDVFTNEDK